MTLKVRTMADFLAANESPDIYFGLDVQEVLISVHKKSQKLLLRF